MKLLFIENRQATYLWEAIARLLEKDGHEIHWIVQNHSFAPSVGKVNIIPYPTRQDTLTGDLPCHLKAITRSDRNVNYFGGDAWHYRYYDHHIRQILKSVSPDFAFGEQTLFHELLAGHHCRSLKIPYLVPGNTRYPVGRTTFYWYDTYHPFGGSGERLSDNEARILIELVRDCRTAPDYMADSSASLMRRISQILSDRIDITGAYLGGERYNTPSPVRKLALGIAHAQKVHEWERIATKDIDHLVDGKPWLLYPLHVQPESSVDVYGRPWNNQARLIERMALAISRIGGSIAVKPHPRSKYEISRELLNVVSGYDNVIPLAHSVAMREIFPAAPIIVSNTGTALLECVFSGKPAVILGNMPIERFGVRRISAPEQIAAILKESMTGELRHPSEQDAISLIKWLVGTSYKATLLYPSSRKNPVEPVRLQELYRAFSEAIQTRFAPLSECDFFAQAVEEERVDALRNY